MNKKNNYFVLIIICIILLSLVGIMFFNRRANDEMIDDTVKNPDYKLLDDYSRFFTVESCVYKYINLILRDSREDLLKVLDEDYVNKNNINQDNIYNYIEKLDGVYSFKAKKIYYENIDNNFIKYYVYGYLVKETMDEIVDKQDNYYIVSIDKKNSLFSISPYDGSMFKEVNNE